jgi:hypothetical protein
LRALDFLTILGNLSIAMQGRTNKLLGSHLGSEYKESNMTNQCDEKSSNNILGISIAVGSGIGSAFGVTFGVVFDVLSFSLGVGVAIGTGLGVAIGSMLQAKKKQF